MFASEWQAFQIIYRATVRSFSVAPAVLLMPALVPRVELAPSLVNFFRQ